MSHRPIVVNPALEREGTEMSDLSELLGIAIHRWPNGPVVIRLAGSLDADGAARLIEAMSSLETGIGDRVALHADVGHVDAAGVGALFYADAYVRARGGVLEIVPSPAVRAALEGESVGLRLPTDPSAVRL
jgi:anti-anti-sigma regulatory factor